MIMLIFAAMLTEAENRGSGEQEGHGRPLG